MAKIRDKKRMDKHLRKYAGMCAALSVGAEGDGKKEDRIKELVQLARTLQTRGNCWNFLLEQIGYLGRYCLFWQTLWIALFSYLIQCGIPYLGSNKNESGVLVLVSLLPPLLVLLTVEEITKVYQRSMLEIEYVTKYSLRSVVLVRMLVLSAVHFVILAVTITVFHARLDSGIGMLFIYGFTPMIIATGVLMRIMQHCQGEQLRSVGVGGYVLMVVFAVAGNTRYVGLYQPARFKIWCAAFVSGSMFCIWQFVCLRRRLASFEQIVRTK